MFIDIPPIVNYAICQLRSTRDIDDEVLCTIFKSDGAIAFLTEDGQKIIFAGPESERRIDIILMGLNGEEPIMVDGACINEPMKRKVTCVWRMESEFKLEARY